MTRARRWTAAPTVWTLIASSPVSWRRRHGPPASVIGRWCSRSARRRRPRLPPSWRQSGFGGWRYATITGGGRVAWFFGAPVKVIISQTEQDLVRIKTLLTSRKHRLNAIPYYWNAREGKRPRGAKRTEDVAAEAVTRAK